jgi:hypothetical protein
MCSLAEAEYFDLRRMLWYTERNITFQEAPKLPGRCSSHPEHELPSPWEEIA